MQIKYNHKNDSCEFVFSWKEIFIIILKRKFYFSPDVFKRFVSSIITIMANHTLNEKDKK